MTETKNSLSFRRIGRFVRILLLFAGGCQILFGLAYLVANLGKMQGFGDTYELLDAGKTFVFDDRTGFFYPLLLAGADLLHKWTGIPFILPVQILQLVLGYGSAYLVLRSFGAASANRRLMETATLFLMTSAPLLQLHLAGLPYSPSLSALCLQFVYQKTAFSKDGSKRQKWILLLFFAVEEWILPWTGFLGLLFAAVCLLVWKKDRKQWGRVILVALVVLCCLRAATGMTFLKAGNRGKMQNSAVGAVSSHLIWSRLASNYFFWDDELKSLISEQDAIFATNTESRFLTVFGHTVDRECGYFGAQKVYLRMAGNVLQNRTKEVFTDQVEELRAYAFMPAVICENLNGWGRSQSGFNVGRLREHAPEAGMRFLMLSFYVIPITLILSGLYFLLISKKKTGKGLILLFVLYAITLVITAFFGYFPFDYKRGYLLWFLMELPGAVAMASETEAFKR